MELDFDFAAKVAGAILTVGTGFMGLCWKGGKWVGARLFHEETGLLTRMTDAHVDLVGELKAMPAVMRSIQIEDQKQTELLEQIVEQQVGKQSHPFVLHEKLNLMIQAKISIKQAFQAYMADDKGRAEQLLNEAEELLTKALNI